MKKIIFSFVVSIGIFFTLLSTDVSAELIRETVSSPETIYEDEDIRVECELIIQEADSNIQTLTTKKSISAKKVATIKSSSGSVLATFTLTGTFSYDGTTATCTAVSYSSSISNSNWSFTSRSASKSGNKATGSYTLKNATTGNSHSGTLTITCSINGAIS